MSVSTLDQDKSPFGLARDNSEVFEKALEI